MKPLDAQILDFLVAVADVVRVHVPDVGVPTVVHVIVQSAAALVDHGLLPADPDEIAKSVAVAAIARLKAGGAA